MAGFSSRRGHVPVGAGLRVEGNAKALRRNFRSGTRVLPPVNGEISMRDGYTTGLKGTGIATLLAVSLLAGTAAHATDGYFANGIGARHKALAGSGVAEREAMEREKSLMERLKLTLENETPIREVLHSVKLPISAPDSTCVPGRRWLYGPIVTPSSTTDRSTTLAQTTESRPIDESTIVVPGPTVLPSAIDVAPRRMTFGSRTTSGATWTPQSR